jgi:hypothetical protein
MSPRAFLLDEEGMGMGRSRLMVAGPGPFPKPHSAHAQIASTGVSHRTYLRRLEGRAFETSRRRDVKLILPLATLAGAFALLVYGWGATRLGYL